MPTVPNKAFLDLAVPPPTILLAGQLWPIPKLAIKQNRQVVDRLVQLLPSMTEAIKDPEWRAKLRTGDPVALRNALSVMTEKNVGLMAEATWIALTRAHPTLKREEFEEMDIGVMELFQAFPVILEQCGVFVEAPKKLVADTQMGEAAAGPQ